MKTVVGAMPLWACGVNRIGVAVTQKSGGCEECDCSQRQKGEIGLQLYAFKNRRRAVYDLFIVAER
jgi:hypothetical protein